MPNRGIGLAIDQASGPRPRSPQFIHRVTKRTFLKREAATADAAYDLVAKLGQGPDPLVEHAGPGIGEIAPVCRSGDMIVRHIGQRVLDDRQRDAGTLGNADDGDPAQDGAVITALVSFRAPA